MGGGGKVPPSIGVKKENKLSLPNPSGNFNLYFIFIIIIYFSEADRHINKKLKRYNSVIPTYTSKVIKIMKMIDDEEQIV